MNQKQLDIVSDKMNTLIIIAKTLTKIRMKREKDDIMEDALKLNQELNKAIKGHRATGMMAVSKKIDALGRKMKSLEEDEAYWKK